VAGRYSGSRWAWQWVAVCCGICGRGCSCGSAVSLSESLKWHALDNNTKSSSQLPCFPVPFPILHSLFSMGNNALQVGEHSFEMQLKPPGTVSDMTADSGMRQWRR